MVHDLKTWPVFLQAVKRGDKTAEMRKADRPYSVGDTLRLREWDPKTEQYTGDVVEVPVTFLLTGETWGVKDGYVIVVLPLGEARRWQRCVTTTQTCATRQAS